MNRIASRFSQVWKSATSKHLFSKQQARWISPKQQSTKQQQQRNYYNAYEDASSARQQDTSKQIAKAIAGGALLVGGGYFLFATLNNPTTSSNTTTTTTTSTMQHIPEYVRNYVFNTYKYVGLGGVLTGAAAMLAHKYGLSYRIMQMGNFAYLAIFLVGTGGTLFVTRSIDPENTVAKHAALMAFNAVMGVSLAPFAMVAPNILVRAGLYTLGIMATMSFVAMNAKEEQFLYLGGPLLAGSAVIFLASLANLFMPPRFARTLQITDALVLYGGLALFTAYLLYDTQVVMKHARLYEVIKQKTLGIRAEDAPDANELLHDGVGNEMLTDSSWKEIVPSVADMQQARMTSKVPQPDYVNESLRLYMDMVNIFIRLVVILQRKNDKK